jgi:hypothetical protein
MLDAKERDAKREQELATKGAKEAAAEAQRLAAQAAERAKVAEKAGSAAQVRPLPLEPPPCSRLGFRVLAWRGRAIDPHHKHESEARPR